MTNIHSDITLRFSIQAYIDFGVNWMFQCGCVQDPILQNLYTYMGDTTPFELI